MRKFIASAILLSLFSVAMVGNCFAYSFSVEKVLVIKKQITAEAIAEPMFFYTKPMNKHEQRKYHLAAGVNQRVETRCNSPTERHLQNSY